MSDNEPNVIYSSVDLKEGYFILNIRAMDGAGMSIGLTPDEAMELAIVLHSAAGAVLGVEPADEGEAA